MKSNMNTTLELMVNRSKIHINVSDIYYIEVQDKLCVIKLKNRESIQIFASINQLQKKLPEGEFIRISRSLLVSCEKVEWIKDEVVLNDGQRLKYSNRKKAQIVRQYKQYLFQKIQEQGYSVREHAQLLVDFSETYSNMNHFPVACLVFKVCMDVWEEGMDFRIMYANEKMARIMGMSVEQLIDRKLCEILFSGCRAKVMNGLAQVAYDGGTKEIIFASNTLQKKIKIEYSQIHYGYCACMLWDVTNKTYASHIEGQTVYEQNTEIADDSEMQSFVQLGTFDNQNKGGETGWSSNVLQALFQELYEVDVKNETIFISNSRWVSDLIGGETHYSVFEKDFAKNRVLGNYKMLFLKEFSIGALKLLAKKKNAKKTIGLYVQEQGGALRWMEITVLCVPDSKNKVYIGMQERTSERMNQIFAQIMLEDYDMVMTFHEETDVYMIYRMEESEFVSLPAICKGYTEYIKKYVKQKIVPSQQQDVLKKMEFSYVAEQLKNNSCYIFEADYIQKDKSTIRKKHFYRYDKYTGVLILSRANCKE